MNYTLVLIVIVALFIGANLMCSCCRYPVFDYIMGRGGSILEGAANRDAGTPGSDTSVQAASNDAQKMIKKKQTIPDIIDATAATVEQAKKDGMTGNKEGFLPDLFKTGLDVASRITEGMGPLPREETIPVKKDGREGLALMGSNINEVQNGDVSNMWVTKANTYASEFGYGIINNTGSAYTADEPLKNGELVIFA